MGIRYANPSINAINDSAGNPLYYGEAKEGSLTSAAAWSVKKCTWDAAGGILTQKWADGNTADDNVWDNYASLNYL